MTWFPPPNRPLSAKLERAKWPKRVEINSFISETRSRIITKAVQLTGRVKRAPLHSCVWIYDMNLSSIIFWIVQNLHVLNRVNIINYDLVV